MPVSITRLRELIELASSPGVADIDIVEDGTRITITRSGDGPLRHVKPPAQTQVPATLPVNRDILPSPMFGVLHLTPAPDAAPYVKTGDLVSTGQQLCLIEAMKMFNAVFSDRNGRIAAILAATGSEVSSGQPLFRIVDGHSDAP